MPSYRLKTHEELLESGFAVTPERSYIHTNAETLTREMIAYGLQLNDAVIACIFNTFGGRKFIDRYVFCADHFVEIPLLTIVRSRDEEMRT